MKSSLTIVLCLCGLSSLSGSAHTVQVAATQRNPFVAVFIDRKTEDRLGPFPYDRMILAEAVRRSADLGAKGVVLKFFLDLPRSASGDRALAEAMKTTKVILQAGDGESSLQPNLLPDKFKMSLNGMGETRSPIASTGGVPLPELLAAAYDVGFVDNARFDRTPVIERYGDGYVKWLYTSCLELALGETARVMPGVSIQFGDKALVLNDRSEVSIQFPDRDNLEYISLVDFLDRSSHPDVKDRVVIVGFDGERVPTVQTPVGRVGVHRVFYYGLESLYASLRQ